MAIDQRLLRSSHDASAQEVVPDTPQTLPPVPTNLPGMPIHRDPVPNVTARDSIKVNGEQHNAFTAAALYTARIWKELQAHRAILEEQKGSIDKIADLPEKRVVAFNDDMRSSVTKQLDELLWSAITRSGQHISADFVHARASEYS
jgi:hypothetical protein